MQPPWRVPYRPRATPLILCGLFFCFCAVSLACRAATNDRGLILNGIITFSPYGASVFYWTLSASSGLFVVVAILAFTGVRSSAFLELTADALLIPRGSLGRRPRRICYTEIVSISEFSVVGSKSLGIHTTTGQCWIASTLLPSREDYEALKRFLILTAASNQSLHATAAKPGS